SGDKFAALRKKGETHPIEATGEKLRAMMPWIGKNKLVNKSAN
ncbi:MAG: ketol-acid reductoisomerase, partial [Rickettsiales bacterium]